MTPRKLIYSWDPQNPSEAGSELLRMDYAQVFTVLSITQMLNVSLEVPLFMPSKALEDALNSIGAQYLEPTEKGRQYLEKR